MKTSKWSRQVSCTLQKTILIKTATLKKKYGVDYLRLRGGKVIIPPVITPSVAPPFSDDEDVFSDATAPPLSATNVVHDGQPSQSTDTTAPIPPSGKPKAKPWSAHATKIPFRAVTILNTLHQNDVAKQPTWSAIATSLLLKYNTKDVVNNTLAPSARGMQVREVTSIGYMLSTVGNTNSSWIDTAPLLKGLLFSYPASPPAYTLDKVTGQFIRGVSKIDPSSFKIYWADPSAHDVAYSQVRVMAVSLPAFVDIARGMDPYFNGDDEVRYFQTDHMDTSWTAIPITSHMIGVPWILEYIIMQLPSSVWCGRSNYVWKADYFHYPTTTFKNKLATQFSGIPMAHNVHIGGFFNVMLVCVDDNSYYDSGMLNIRRVQQVKVYAGARKRTYTREQVLEHIYDISQHVSATTTNAGYLSSATQMSQAVDALGRLLSQDGAMRMAVSLAAELSSVMFQSPTVDYKVADKVYSNKANGAWTFGVGTFGDALNTKDAWEGTEDQRTKRFQQMFNGFNFSSISPCGFAPTSYVNARSVDVFNNTVKPPEYEATVVAWENTNVSALSCGYRAHVASSYYRVLIGLNMMQTEEYGYCVLSTAGLQSTLAMQAMALTLSLGRMLAFNGFGMRIWTGYEMSEQFHAAYPFAGLIAELTYSSIVATDPMTLHDMARVGGDISVYYNGDGWEDKTWGHHLPIPSWLVESWNLHFASQFPRDFQQKYQSITRNSIAYLTQVVSENLSGLHSVSSTLDYAGSRPVTTVVFGSVGDPVYTGCPKNAAGP